MKHTKIKQTLSIVQSMQLCNFIVSDYVKFGLGDTKFAEFASVKLGFSIQSSAVATRRRELGIESNTVVIAELRKNTSVPGRDSHNERLYALETKVKLLMMKLEPLLK